MKTLYSGSSLLLTEHDEGRLILDLRRGATLSRDQVATIEPAGLTYAGDETWTGQARDQAEIVAAVRRLDRPRMQVLHNGPSLILKLDSVQNALILDRKFDSQLTDAQVRRLDRHLDLADEDCWLADASRRHQVEALVRQIDSPKVAKDPEESWTSQAERSRAEQQRVGGR